MYAPKNKRVDLLLKFMLYMYYIKYNVSLKCILSHQKVYGCVEYITGCCSAPNLHKILMHFSHA